MDKESALKYLPMVKALSEGKDIQFFDGYEWIGAVNPIFSSSDVEKYRVKPEPREYWFNGNYTLTSEEYKSGPWDKAGPFIKLVEVIE